MLRKYQFVVDQLNRYRGVYKRYYNKFRVFKYKRFVKRRLGSFVIYRSYLIFNKKWYGCKKNILNSNKFLHKNNDNMVKIVNNIFIVSVVNWFYKKFLKKKYPLLDIKKIFWF